MPRYVDLDNPKIIRGERDRFGLVVYHIPPDTPCLNFAERDKGEWILVTDNNGQHYECSRCGAWRYHQEQEFCGSCGVDMRGKNSGKTT